MMTWQARIRNERTGGTMACGATAASYEDAWRKLDSLLSWPLVVISIKLVPPVRYRSQH